MLTTALYYWERLPKLLILMPFLDRPDPSSLQIMALTNLFGVVVVGSNCQLVPFYKGNVAQVLFWLEHNWAIRLSHLSARLNVVSC